LEFNNKNDVWDYIGEISEESKEFYKDGSRFNILRGIYEQLPFFCCNNIILDKEHQKDIAKFLYCQDTGVPPYPGSFGDQPTMWIAKYYIIKEALSLNAKIMRENNG